MPKRAKSTGTEPGMSSMLGPGTGDEQWSFPQYPGRTGERTLMSVALRIDIQVIFETHVYSFGGTDFIQSDGGPIGLRFTGVIAKIRMNHWSKQVIKIL